MGKSAEGNSYFRRIAWFAAIWIASVVVLSIIAYGIRLIIG